MDLGAYRLAVGYWDHWADDVWIHVNHMITEVDNDIQKLLIFTPHVILYHEIPVGYTITDLKWNEALWDLRAECTVIKPVNEIQVTLAVS